MYKQFIPNNVHIIVQMFKSGSEDKQKIDLHIIRALNICDLD